MNGVRWAPLLLLLLGASFASPALLRELPTDAVGQWTKNDVAESVAVDIPYMTFAPLQSFFSEAF